MKRPDLERTAYVVECFFNALRLPEGAERARVETIVTRWLAAPGHRDDEFLVYRDGKLECWARGREYNAFEMPDANPERTLWCNGSQIETIDGLEFRNSGKVVKLGTDGLDFSLPPMALPQAEERLAGGEVE